MIDLLPDASEPGLRLTHTYRAACAAVFQAWTEPDALGQSTNVPRPRLTARLHGALSCALTLVMAPAGYGKTTLLQSWIAELEAATAAQPADAALAPQLAWLALDPADNGPARFLAAMVAALAEVPGIDVGPARELVTSPEALARRLLAALSQGLAAVPAHVVLVLDD